GPYSKVSLMVFLKVLTIHYTCFDSHFPLFKDSAAMSYNLVMKKMRWSNAQAYCRRHHKDLAHVRNQEEKDIIFNIIQNSTETIAWTGFYRDPWAFWSDSSTSNFTNWSNGQPDNFELNQFCARFSGLSGVWDDVVCGTKHPFFCYSGEV
uniref:C-type lectin domain-containing protein n=1 Tax=Sphaeramia orbicularis TaxID=375764 RepID=A0A673AJE4_9TELE